MERSPEESHKSPYPERFFQKNPRQEWSSLKISPLDTKQNYTVRPCSFAFPPPRNPSTRGKAGNAPTAQEGPDGGLGLYTGGTTCIITALMLPIGWVGPSGGHDGTWQPFMQPPPCRSPRQCLSGFDSDRLFDGSLMKNHIGEFGLLKSKRKKMICGTEKRVTVIK